MAETIYNGVYSVYVHINKINNKKYVGLTSVEPEKRWNKGNGYHYNKHFFGAIKKYGWDGFEHEVIASHLTKQEAENFEKLLIKQLQCYKPEFGYNNDMGGNAADKISEQTRRRLSESHMGQKPTEYQRRRTSESLFERWSNQEIKDKFSLLMKEKWKDEEFRARVFAGRKNVRYDTRNVSVVCDGIEYRNVRDFAESNGLNRYTVNNWLNGNHTMPEYWYNKGLRNKEEARNKKIRKRGAK